MLTFIKNLFGMGPRQYALLRYNRGTIWEKTKEGLIVSETSTHYLIRSVKAIFGLEFTDEDWVLKSHPNIVQVFSR